MIHDIDRFDESAAVPHGHVFETDGRYVFTRAGSRATGLTDRNSENAFEFVRLICSIL